MENAIKLVAPGVQPRILIWAQEVQSAESGSPHPESPHQSTHPQIHSSNPLVRINIQDNGIGIEAEHCHRVFAMFQRIHLASEYEGTGMGLTIVRRAAERMGGRVGFDSEPGKGSTFWLKLPRGE